MQIYNSKICNSKIWILDFFVDETASTICEVIKYWRWISEWEDSDDIEPLRSQSQEISERKMSQWELFVLILRPGWKRILRPGEMGNIPVSALLEIARKAIYNLLMKVLFREQAGDQPAPQLDKLNINYSKPNEKVCWAAIVYWWNSSSNNDSYTLIIILHWTLLLLFKAWSWD